MDLPNESDKKDEKDDQKVKSELKLNLPDPSATNLNASAQEFVPLAKMSFETAFEKVNGRSLPSSVKIADLPGPETLSLPLGKGPKGKSHLPGKPIGLPFNKSGLKGNLAIPIPISKGKGLSLKPLLSVVRRPGIHLLVNYSTHGRGVPAWEVFYMVR